MNYDDLLTFGTIVIMNYYELLWITELLLATFLLVVIALKLHSRVASQSAPGCRVPALRWTIAEKPSKEIPKTSRLRPESAWIVEKMDLEK